MIKDNSVILRISIVQINIINCSLFVNERCYSTDGSSLSPREYGSFGGLARNDEGRWIEGFCGFIGGDDVLRAKLWGIRKSLKLAKERDLSGIDIASDSKMRESLWEKLALLPCGSKLINEMDEVDYHLERVLIEHCIMLKAEVGAKVYHILKERNKCDDTMVRI